MSKGNYKTLVLAYLTAHIGENVSRDELIKSTGISKPRLSEVINSIRDDGYTIITPPRSGIVKLEANNDETVLPPIKDSDIRQWLILYILSRCGAMTFRELIINIMNLREPNSADSNLLNIGKVKAYDDNHLTKAIRENKVSEYLSEDDINVASDFISVPTLRKDLSTLRKQGLVDQIKGSCVKYALSSNAPYLIPVSDSALYDFCQAYEENLTSLSESNPAKMAFTKIKTLIEYDGSETPQRRFGRQNQISSKLLQKLEEFFIYPYKTNRLKIRYHYRNTAREALFAVALIYYSVETDAFYIFGENYTKGSADTIRLDYIISIDTSEEKNDVFHSRKYFDMYLEMFAAGFEVQVHHVKVLFQGKFNIGERFKALATNRLKATITPIKNKPTDCIYDFIYEDDLRGLSDFARFLRSFGYSALALEPPELKDLMINSYTRRLEKYATSGVDQNE